MESDKRFSKATILVAAIGVFLASVAFVLGMVTGASQAGAQYSNAEPNENCYPPTDTANLISERHVESVVIACQVMGMGEQEAIAFIEAQGRSWRIASRDGEGFALTEDYTDSRINIGIYYHIVVGASAW